MSVEEPINGTAALPAPKEITRDALAAENFDVEAFLDEHAQFQSLSDMRRRIMNWEMRLHTELVDTVNENYPEFLSSAESLDECLGHLEAVRSEVLRFKSEAVRTETELRAQAAQLETEVRRKRELAVSEALARQILRYLDLLDALEEQLCRPISDLSVEDYEEWSKMYVLVAQLHKRHAESLLVSSSLKRLHAVKAGLLAVFDDIKCEDKFRMAQAKSWILL